MPTSAALLSPANPPALQRRSPPGNGSPRSSVTTSLHRGPRLYCQSFSRQFGVRFPYPWAISSLTFMMVLAAFSNRVSAYLRPQNPRSQPALGRFARRQRRIDCSIQSRSFPSKGPCGPSPSSLLELQWTVCSTIQCLAHSQACSVPPTGFGSRPSRRV